MNSKDIAFIFGSISISILFLAIHIMYIPLEHYTARLLAVCFLSGGCLIIALSPMFIEKVKKYFGIRKIK